MSRVYILQRSFKHSNGTGRMSWPVEAYTTRKAANTEARKLNKNSRHWHYHVRGQSLKVVK